MRAIPRRLSRIRVFTVLVCSLLLAGCASAPSMVRPDTAERGHFRTIEARPTASIFSPLPLPAPNDLRNAAGAPGPAYWQQQVDYVIDAALDETTRAITGRATVTYINNSPDALDYLWLHLEQNVFRADSAGHAIAPNAAIGVAVAEGTGYTIHSIRADGRDLKLDVHDTLGLVHLPRPIAPRGGMFTFEIAWSFVIPERAFRRFGIERLEQGTIFQVAQWFPALAVYDDVHGWNALPYLGTGEFYTNFGNYDLRLTVPRSHLVVATGVLQNPRDVFTPEQHARYERAKTSAETILIRTPREVGRADSRPAGDGPLTWRFKAENVRTVAWASSPAFIYDACALDDTLIQSAYPKEALPLWSKSSQMLRAAIRGYNERWFRYPYPAAINVNGIEGGMEYPMIIFCRARNDERGLYGVTTHEIGHNWFPMIVNTDERRHAWMDEGLNTFINHYSWGDWFAGETVGRRAVARDFAANMLDPDDLPIMTPADHHPRRLLGRNQYTKPAVGLVLLREQILGPERFDFAFRTYIRRWAFKSPQPADFFRTMEDAAGADLAWFWRGWFMETGHLDQAVVSVNYQAETKKAVMTLDSRGELVMPVVFRAVYVDGSEEVYRLPVEIWFNTRRFTHTWNAPAAVRRIVIDPDEAFPDVDRSNNTWNR